MVLSCSTTTLLALLGMETDHSDRKALKNIFTLRSKFVSIVSLDYNDSFPLAYRWKTGQQTQTRMFFRTLHTPTKKYFPTINYSATSVVFGTSQNWHKWISGLTTTRRNRFCQLQCTEGFSASLFRVQKQTQLELKVKHNTEHGEKWVSSARRPRFQSVGTRSSGERNIMFGSENTPKISFWN